VPIVCDASALVALLVDDGPDGTWTSERLGRAELVAPSLASFETANILRRLELAGSLSADLAAQAHVDLAAMAIDLWPYELLAARAWELRENLSINDASYVALAELVGAPLVTLDRRIAGAPGPRCPIETP
jgi:predicted nucleic acid-binding protein